jgi:hypothetical protein
MVVPTKTKNPVNADATHILSNMTMTLLSRCHPMEQ